MEPDKMESAKQDEVHIPVDRMRHLVLAAIVIILVLWSDQWSKNAVLAAFERGGIPYDVTSWFTLTLVWNRGVSFGMLAQDAAWGPWLLKGLAAVLMIVLLRWLWQATHWVQALALGLVLGGAVGNVLDRFYHGAVVDFLDFHYLEIHYPAFNIADAAICIGVVILVLESIVSARKNPSSSSTAS
jgi:signal peptidase II